jgi:hypothetical protein
MTPEQTFALISTAIGILFGGLVATLGSYIQNRWNWKNEERKRKWILEDEKKQLERSVRDKRLDQIESYVDEVANYCFTLFDVWQEYGEAEAKKKSAKQILSIDFPKRYSELYERYKLIRSITSVFDDPELLKTIEDINTLMGNMNMCNYVFYEYHHEPFELEEYERMLGNFSAYGKRLVDELTKLYKHIDNYRAS